MTVIAARPDAAKSRVAADSAVVLEVGSTQPGPQRRLGRREPLEFYGRRLGSGLAG